MAGGWFGHNSEAPGGEFAPTEVESVGKIGEKVLVDYRSMSLNVPYECGLVVGGHCDEERLCGGVIVGRRVL